MCLRLLLQLCLIVNIITDDRLNHSNQTHFRITVKWHWNFGVSKMKREKKRNQERNPSVYLTKSMCLPVMFISMHVSEIYMLNQFS